ncbi:RND family transporter [Mycobacterium sp. Aquia_213]|uniref:MMPL/RND family transporter n=1 Tax=Mycobacterium sp. Aquia_213 TaxID=2991728 RepID=UPI00226DD43A|nr:MMPL family transporter [Mycobacterium sp. Aquia_213]WAC89572.1 MMPL family transporter [Mycobacterium sp. Aquia_213]
MTADSDAGPLHTVARTVRWLAVAVILFWVALCAVMNTVTPPLSEVAGKHAVSFSAHDAPSLIGMKRIGRNFQQFDSDTTAMVVLEGRDKLGESAHRFYDSLIAKLREDKAHIEHVENFWGDSLTAAGSQSTDGKAAYVQLYLAGDQGSSMAHESVGAVERIVDGMPAPPGIKAYVTGPGPLEGDQHTYGDRSLEKITLITVVVIAIMLLITYRSVSTVVLVLLTVGVELLTAEGIIATLANNNVIALSTFAVNVLVALAIAASTDYIIFLIGRYQEARAAGVDREPAYYAMFHGTTHVIVASGLTVAGAMYCLSFTRLPVFNTLGWPCSLAILVVIVASLTLAPAVIAVGGRLGAFDPKRQASTRRWRRIGTVVVRWPGPVLVAAILVSLIGLIALPMYQTGYNGRYYIPADTPSNIGYEASDRHFAAARMEPELLMIEADHDLRNPTDMLILDRVAHSVFHTPGIARVQSITRPLGSPIDHASIPFQISAQSAVAIENLNTMRERIADMSRMTNELQHMIDVSLHIQDLTRQLTNVTHGMATDTQQMRATTDELRDHLSDFDDFWRPIRSYFYWERHCFDVPLCWSLRSLFDGIDGIDRLSEDVGNLAHHTDQLDRLMPQMAAQMPPLIAAMQTVKELAQTATSTFSGLITQMDALTRNATVMGRAFDGAKNDDFFYLPPEAFENPDFQRGLTMFLSPDGSSARFIITHKGDPATAEGISHIDLIRQAADEAVKGTPLAAANIYLTGTASTYKDEHDGSMYDLMIAATASLCLIFMIMLAITGSVVASAVIVGTVTISLGSSFGLSVLIWQHMLHQPLHWLVLAMAIIVMLAVGSDYNLLLAARFREEVGAGLKTGMIRSMGSTGGVVTTAGLVFAFTMGAMVTSDLRVVGQIGTTIMIGLLFDTLIVRSFMMPAAATLLGRWFWWPRQVPTHAAPRPARPAAVEQRPAAEYAVSAPTTE